MTIPSVVRVFFAIDLSQDVKEAIGDFICTLKKKSRSKGIRWSRPENLHITLQFLAEVKSEHLPALIENVKARLAVASQASTLSFDKLILFPTPFRPRVIVLDVTPQEGLAEISRVIGEGIQATHYEIDRRPFRAHLTLGRIKNPQGVNLDFLTEVEPLEVGRVDLNEVVLFQSEPHADGSRYTPLERLPLIGP